MKPTAILYGMIASAAGCSAAPEEMTPAALSTNGATTAAVIGAETGATIINPEATRMTSAAAANQAKLALGPEGLRWFLPPDGSARPLPFGMAQADVLDSLERVRGEAAKGTNADCGAGPVQYANWADGLSLVFKDGRFAGWGLDGRAGEAITTADGIGIGTTRAELDAATGPTLVVRQTSLGTEFTAGAYHGLFDSTKPDARVTDMWVGVSCVAR